MKLIICYTTQTWQMEDSPRGANMLFLLEMVSKKL